ncbi:hypothetical protein EDC50_2057 [Vulcaniibacterium tengchongense]|uniref:TonB-like protein n=2 Tax=Vulcaniibacterium tengchongense TaxID=1273429 RepID=A0A3N4VFC7_9GAMM|nr:hypothetical protein EDC50_2057 [Vulcaniibacterium tengchongense]
MTARIAARAPLAGLLAAAACAAAAERAPPVCGLDPSPQRAPVRAGGDAPMLPTRATLAVVLDEAGRYQHGAIGRSSRNRLVDRSILEAAPSWSYRCEPASLAGPHRVELAIAFDPRAGELVAENRREADDPAPPAR